MECTIEEIKAVKKIVPATCLNPEIAAAQFENST
jgi:hypothetical protein